MIKDKDLGDVKTLIGVKDCVMRVYDENDATMLILDQLDEYLKFLASNGLQKDKEIKQAKKLFDDWNGLKKLAKDVKKEIAPMIDNESKKNLANITKHDEELKNYIINLKKRNFYRYDTGREASLSALETVNTEIEGFIGKTEDLKNKAIKFDHPNSIEAS